MSFVVNSEVLASTLLGMALVKLAGGTVYDLQSSRYLVQEMSNEEPLFVDMPFEVDHFSTGSVQRMAEK